MKQHEHGSWISLCRLECVTNSINISSYTMIFFFQFKIRCDTGEPNRRAWHIKQLSAQTCCMSRAKWLQGGYGALQLLDLSAGALWCWRYKCYNSPTISIWHHHHHHAFLFISFTFCIFRVPFHLKHQFQKRQWVPSTAINYFISLVQVRDRHVVSKWSGCLYIIKMWKVVLSLLLIGKPAVVQTECLDQSSALRTLLKVLFLSALLGHVEMSHNSSLNVCPCHTEKPPAVEEKPTAADEWVCWQFHQDFGLIGFIFDGELDGFSPVLCQQIHYICPNTFLKNSFKRIHTVLILYEFKIQTEQPR